MTTLKNTLSEDVFFYVNGFMISVSANSMHAMDAAVLPNSVVEVWVSSTNTILKIPRLVPEMPQETRKVSAGKKIFILRGEKRRYKEYYIISTEEELPTHVIAQNLNVSTGAVFYFGMRAYAVSSGHTLSLTSGVHIDDLSAKVSVLLPQSGVYLTLSRGRSSKSTAGTASASRETVVFAVDYDAASDTETFLIRLQSPSASTSPSLFGALRDSNSFKLQDFVSGAVMLMFNAPSSSAPLIFEEIGINNNFLGLWKNFINSQNLDPFINVYGTSGSFAGGCSCPGVDMGIFTIPGPCYGGSGFISIDIGGLAGLSIVETVPLQFELAAVTPSATGFVSSFSISGAVSVDMTGTAHLGFSFGFILECKGHSFDVSLSSGTTTVDFVISVPLTIAANGEMTIDLPQMSISLSNLQLGLLENAMSEINKVANDLPGFGKVCIPFLGCNGIYPDFLQPKVQELVTDGNNGILSAISKAIPASIFNSLPSISVFVGAPTEILTTDLKCFKINGGVSTCCKNVCGSAPDGFGGTTCPSPPAPQVCDTVTNTWCSLQCTDKCNKADDGCHGTRCPSPPPPQGPFWEYGYDVCDTTTNSWCATTCGETQSCGPSASNGCNGVGCPNPEALGEGKVCFNGKYCAPKCKGVGPAGDDSCGGTRCVCNLWELPADSDKICVIGPSPLNLGATFYASYLITNSLSNTILVDPGAGSVNQLTGGFNFPVPTFAFGAGLKPGSSTGTKYPDYWIFENVQPSLFTACAVYSATYPIIYGCQGAGQPEYACTYCSSGGFQCADCNCVVTQSFGNASYYIPKPSPSNIPSPEAGDPGAYLQVATNKSDAALFTISENEKGALNFSTTLNGNTYFLCNNFGSLSYSVSSKAYLKVIGGCLQTLGPPASALNCSWYPGSVCEGYKCVVPSPAPAPSKT